MKGSNKFRLIFIAVLLVALAALWWWVWHPQSESPQARRSTVVETPDSEAESVKTSVGSESESPEPQRHNASDAWWRIPIVFYGKVVDEKDQPIAGASIDYSVNDDSPDGRSEYHSSSGLDGSFV